MKKIILWFVVLFIFLMTTGSVFAGMKDIEIKLCADGTCSSFVDGKPDPKQYYLTDPTGYVDAGTYRIENTYYVFASSAWAKLNVSFNGNQYTLNEHNEAGSTVILTLSAGDIVTISDLSGTKTLQIICTQGGGNSNAGSSSDSESKDIALFIYPEDEIGAYYLNADSKKEYIWFHSYDICKRFMPNPDFCSDYQH